MPYLKATCAEQFAKQMAHLAAYIRFWRAISVASMRRSINNKEKSFPRILSVFFHALVLVPSIGTAADVQVSFGIIQGVGMDRRIIEETTSIPLRYRNTGFVWGFVVRSTPPGNHDGHFVLRLPKVPRTIGSNVRSQSQLGEDGRVITKNFRLTGGEYWQSIVFDEGDPPGTWHLVVYLNGKVVRAFPFEVKVNE